jgi:hypothetical protein
MNTNALAIAIVAAASMSAAYSTSALASEVEVKNDYSSTRFMEIRSGRKDNCSENSLELKENMRAREVYTVDYDGVAVTKVCARYQVGGNFWSEWWVQSCPTAHGESKTCYLNVK